jgi:hypothetical protein
MVCYVFICFTTGLSVSQTGNEEQRLSHNSSKGVLLAKTTLFVVVGNRITARSPGTIPEAYGHLRDTAYWDGLSL